MKKDIKRLGTQNADVGATAFVHASQQHTPLTRHSFTRCVHVVLIAWRQGKYVVKFGVLFDDEFGQVAVWRAAVLCVAVLCVAVWLVAVIIPSHRL